MEDQEDYSSALAVTLRVRLWLALLLLLIIGGELTVFFLFRYELAWQPRAIDLLEYCTGLCEFVGVALAILLVIDLLIALNITLAARLPGAAGLVRAIFTAAILLLLLFPWQAFLANATFTSPEFKIPGVLYTWEELALRGRWDSQKLDIWRNMLHWARFVAFPLAALIVLLTVLIHSRPRSAVQ